MQPKTTSGSSSRYQPSINEPPTQDDTMLMGFEFFDEKGRLNPRNILFSAQTSPSKANSIVTTLFGKVMQWGACRWAKNFLKHAQTSQAAGTGETREKIADLLTNIRQSGSVKMTQFFEVSMPAIIETKNREDSPATDPNLKNKKASAFQSAPSLINSADVIQYYKPASPQKPISLRNALIKSREIKKNESIKPIIDELINYQKGISETGKMENKLTEYITNLFESGFLEHCQYGSPTLRYIDIENLDKFLKDYRNNFHTLKDVLNKEQFAQLSEQRTKTIADISFYKKSNPDYKEKLSGEKEKSTPSEKIVGAKIPLRYNDIPGLFRNKSDVNYQDLDQVGWGNDDLHLQINSEDALKIRQYFSTAPLDQDHLQLAKKIYSLSRKIQLAHFAGVPAIAQDKPAPPQDPGSLLSETYGAFLERYKLNADNDKKSASITKKSKNKKSGAKERERVEKIRKKKINDRTEPLQSARKQLDEANALIERINKKNTTSPKKANKHFL